MPLPYHLLVLSRFREWLPRAAVLVATWALALLALASASASAASPLPVAGDGEHLWIVQRAEPAEAQANADDDETPGEPRWLVRHRGGDAVADVLDPEALAYAGTLDAPVGAAAAAASRSTLWVVDGDRVVHRFRAAPAEARPGWAYSRRRGPRLPEHTTLRTFDVGQGSAFALTRVASSATLRELDEADEPVPPLTAIPSDEQILRWMLLGIPPDDVVAPQPPATDAEPAAPHVPDSPEAPDGEELPLPPGPVMRAEPEEPSPEAAPTEPDDELEDEPVDVDRLLHLRGGRWRVVPLPEAWSYERSAEAHVALLAPEAADRPLRLLVQHGAELRLYSEAEDADAAPEERWSYDDYVLERDAPVTPMVLERQLVVAQIAHDADASAAEMHLSVLRRGAVRSVGTLRLDVETARVAHSGVAPVSAAAALVVETDRRANTRGHANVRELWWARMNLHGETVAEPAELLEADGPALEHLTDYIILVAVLALAILMMLLFWRRDASQFQLALPAELALGSLPRRVGAGVLDLAPPVAVAMLVFEVGFAELPHRWPGVGQARGLMDIAPGALAIGLFIAHTLIAELIFARSFGKALLGLRVSTLRGERPRIWQLLVRNVLKSFDLVAWLLLVLIVIGPFRQRLGDLLARTVVVMPVEPSATNQQQGQQQQDE